jgi:hypothetical protein
MKTLRIAAAAAALLLATSAQAMTVAEFVRRADVVMSSGLFALANPDVPVLRGEVRTAIAALRTEEDAARQRGRRAPFCLPPRGTEIDPFEMLAELRALPAPQQRLQVKDGLRLVAIRRYRCQ